MMLTNHDESSGSGVEDVTSQVTEEIELRKRKLANDAVCVDEILQSSLQSNEPDTGSEFGAEMNSSENGTMENSDPPTQRPHGGSFSGIADNLAVEELSEERKLLQQKLSSKGALFDPRCKEWVAQWLLHNEDPNTSSSSSHPEQSVAKNDGPKCEVKDKERFARDVDHVIGMLSTGYDPYGECIRKLIEWVDLVEKPKKTTSASAKLLPDVSPGTLAAMEHFRELALREFAPSKAFSILAADQKSPPPWLIQMLDSPFWRSLLILLADKHTENPFLDFGVKVVLEGGHHAEIAQLTNTATYFAVYRQALIDLLKEIFDCIDPRNDKRCLESTVSKLGALETRFMKFCFFSQYTYLFAVEVLEELTKRLTPKEGCSQISPRLIARKQTLIKLRQLLSRKTTDPAHAVVVDQMQPYNRRSPRGLSAASESGGIPEIGQHVRDIVGGGATPEKISRLRDLYDSNISPHAFDYPVWPLRSSEFILAFVSMLYDPNRRVDSHTSSNIAFLLAVATARIPENAFNQPLENNVTHAIVESSALCNAEPSSASMREGSHQMTRLAQLAESFSIVCTGVIYWIRVFINTQSFQDAGYFSFAAAAMLSLLRIAQKTYPMQRLAVMWTILNAIDIHPRHVQPATLLELRKSMINELIMLMASGLVPQVLDAVKLRLADGKMDQVIIRHFVVTLSTVVDEPFSYEFASKTLAILNHESCARSVRGNSLVARNALKDYMELKNRCVATVVSFNSQSSPPSSVPAQVESNAAQALPASSFSSMPPESSERNSVNSFVIGIAPFKASLENNRQ